MQKYYQNEPRFNGAYSRDNLPDKVKHGRYINKFWWGFNIGTHWIALDATNGNITYFDSFGVEHIPKEIKILQAYDSIMCGYFRTGFIDLMLQGKTGGISIASFAVIEAPVGTVSASFSLALLIFTGIVKNL